jgi:DNA (cytosine-5)-methyltransferase 1
MSRPICIDLFAGGGGASVAIARVTGRDPAVAVNHDPKAIAMHAANHPGTLHVCQDIWSCPPQWAARGRVVAHLHASPDCTHFSKAKGAAPRRDAKRRDLAWVVVKWARELLPNLITLENVEEIQTWGPLDHDGHPIKSQAGTSWRSFIHALRRLGYAVEWRELRACDYGAPTIRKRLFLIARRDGRPIVWPKPTHGDPASPAVKSGKLLPWRTAAECIDWRIPCPSIFERPRPLAEATLHRIAEGIQRYVIAAARPYIVNLTHGVRLEPLDEPARTITGAHRGEKALVAPILAGAGGPVYAGKPVAVDRPMNTLMTENHEAVIAPALVTNTSGHAPRSVSDPVATLTTGGHQMLAAAHLAKHYGGVVGQELDRPIGTVTTVDHHSLVAVHMRRDFGQSVGGAADAPCGTVTAGGGGKTGLVTSCLIKYYGQGGQHSSPAEPLHTIPTKDRMAVVEAREIGDHAAEVRDLLSWHRRSKTVKAWGYRCDDLDGLLSDAFAGEVVIEGALYTIADIGMRMLQPRELYRAQGFPNDYIIGDDPAQGLALTKAEQVRMCGNSVCPDVLAALLRVNYTEDFVTAAAREARALPLLGVGR